MCFEPVSDFWQPFAMFKLSSIFQMSTIENFNIISELWVKQGTLDTKWQALSK